jgi:hypothetical protein
MPYKMAGIDVHKRMLHVVVSDVEVDGEYEFALRRTRPRRQSEVQTGARSKNDPRTPQARVPRRTDYPPASYGNLGGRFSTLPTTRELRWHCLANYTSPRRASKINHLTALRQE